jgi:uncharacterized protein (TIGR02996 family)
VARARPPAQDPTAALEAAAAAADRSAWPDVLAHLVAGWRLEPATPIARLAGAAATRVPAPAIPGKTLGEREDHWHDLAATRDDASLPRLLATPWPTHPREARARVEALAAFERSPLIGNAFLAVHARRQYTSNAGAKVSRRMFQILIDAGDPAVTAYFATLDASTDHVAVRERAAIAAAVRRRRTPDPELPATALAALARIEALVAPRAIRTGTADELLAAIYAAPFDDAPRSVYADFLMETGDPRGELIALQLRRGRGEGKRADVTRERALLREAGNRWYDGLDRAGASGIVLERGFPALAQTGAFGFAEPAWATIETLVLHDGPAPFRGSPALRALKRLDGILASQLGDVETVPALDFASVRGLSHGLDRETPVAPVVLGFGSDLVEYHPQSWVARIRELAPRLHDWPIGRRLAELYLGVSVGGITVATGLLASVPRLDAVTLHGGFTAYLYLPVQWRTRITRDALRLEWTGRGYSGPPFEQIVDVIRTLDAPAFETFELVAGPAPKAIVAEVTAALRKIVEGWPAIRDVTFR